MKRLGVVGTMVWDTIYGRGQPPHPTAEWGGIAYALAAIDASLPAGWEVVPLIKVGKDLARGANEFLHGLHRRAPTARFIETPEPNTRVTLRYESLARRCEDVQGALPVWRWEEIGPMIRDVDALYVNFISGFELGLEAMAHLRRAFAGPIYADLHSLFLGLEPDGRRLPKPLAHASSWLACFDVVQINEDELQLLGSEPMEVAATSLRAGVRLLVVTLGARGAVYFTTPPFHLFGARDHQPGASPIHTARIPADAVLDEGDTTGCGDVFGGTLVSQLIRGADVEAAIRVANAFARRNVAARGATGLQHHLRGEIARR